MELNEKTLTNILTDQRKEYERYMGALSEDTQSKISAVAEQFIGMQEQFTEMKETLNLHTEILNSHTMILDSHSGMLESHTEMIGQIKEDVEIIKMDIEFIKGGMKKKVDYDEFVVLEKRLSLLESRAAR